MAAQQQYVGIDLHRRRSVIVRKDATGKTLETVHIANDPVTLAEVAARAGEAPEVVLEACYGWYWAADALPEIGAKVHLAHPLGNSWGNRRVKNDERDANDLIDLLRLGRLAEAHIAPRSQRELRELVRHRAKLVALRSGLKAQVHAQLAQQGVPVAVSDLFGRAGRCLLDDVELDGPYRLRVDSLLGLIDAYSTEIDRFTVLVEDNLAGHRGYLAIQAITGVGPVLAAVFVAEIGDVERFAGAAQLCSWADLTPRHRESDIHVARGHITKQGSRLVRWAAVEAVGRQRGATPVAVLNHRVAERRGKNIGRIAGARKPSHPRLLRPARRRDPLPGRRGIRPGRRSQHASSYLARIHRIIRVWGLGPCTEKVPRPGRIVIAKPLSDPKPEAPFRCAHSRTTWTGSRWSSTTTVWSLTPG